MREKGLRKFSILSSLQNDEQQNAAKDEALLDAKKAKDVDENKYKKEENKLNTWHALGRKKNYNAQ